MMQSSDETLDSEKEAPMTKKHFALLGLFGIICFAAGFSLSLAAGKVKTTADLFQGKEAKEAAMSLLAVAEAQAESGSWETIGVGRVYYLGIDKEIGQELFDKVLVKEPDRNDLERIARVYVEAGEWDKAVPIVERMVAMNKKDDDEFILVGSWYNLQGDRDKAEEFFTRAFRLSDDDVWNTINAAGSYVGVNPR
jgi:tetratricopeptide (TPR) repeat protein